EPRLPVGDDCGSRTDCIERLGERTADLPLVQADRHATCGGLDGCPAPTLAPTPGYYWRQHERCGLGPGNGVGPRRSASRRGTTAVAAADDGDGPRGRPGGHAKGSARKHLSRPHVSFLFYEPADGRGGYRVLR